MRYFIISANPKVYNHEEAFKRMGFIDWYDTISNSYKEGDIVYIYMTSTQQITYKTEVVKINLNKNTIQDYKDLWSDKNNYKNYKKYARLKLILELDSKKLNLQKLREKFDFRPPQTGKIQIQNIEFIKYLEKYSKTKANNEIEEMVYPETINEEYFEGAGCQVIVNKYERNRDAREECINIYGSSCFICGFNFEEVYGEIGKNYIHVHHIKPLNQIGKNYKINPKKDLIPICPNCHAMIHKKGNNDVFSVDELREIINNKK